MKKNINILIESIIKNVIRDINRNYIIVEDVLDTLKSGGDAAVDTASDIGSTFISEDTAEAIAVLIGASAINTGENIIPPTQPLLKSATSGVAGFLYCVAGNYFLKLSDQQQEGTQLKSYYKFQGYIYYAIGIFTLGFAVAPAGGMVASYFQNIFNTTTTTHKIANSISTLASLVRTSDIDKFAKDAIKKQPILSNMGFNLKKIPNIEKHIFFIDEGIAFREINGKSHIIIQNNPTGQMAKSQFDSISVNTAAVDLVEIDIATLKTGSLLDGNGNILDDAIEIPIDKIKFKDMDAAASSDMYAAMRASSTDFITDLSTARVRNAKQGFDTSLSEISMDVAKIQRSLSAGTGFSANELRAILEELDELVKNNPALNQIKLSTDEINTFLKHASDPNTREKIENALEDIGMKIDSFQQTKRNIDTSEATGAPQKNTSGSEVECSKIGLNRVKGSEDFLGSGGIRGKGVRKENIADLTSDLVEGQKKVIKQLKTSPIKIPHKLKNRAGTVLYEGELLIFTYRSPGVFIGALSFKKEIRKLENEILSSLEKARGLKREMDDSDFGKYLELDPVTNRASMKNKAKGDDSYPTQNTTGYPDFQVKRQSYNAQMNAVQDLREEVRKLKEIAAESDQPGVIPMAFDMDSHPSLRAKAQQVLSPEEFKSLLALRKELALLPVKNTAWHKVKNAATGTALFFYNNSAMTGAVLTGLNLSGNFMAAGFHLWTGQDVSISEQSITTSDGDVLKIIPSETPGVRVMRELGIEDLDTDEE